MPQCFQAGRMKLSNVSAAIGRTEIECLVSKAMPVFQKNHTFAIQVAPIQMRLHGQLMPAGDGQYKRLEKKGNHPKRRVDKGVRCDHGVQLTRPEFPEQLVGEALSQEQIESRIPFKQRREQMRPHRCDRAQTQGARQGFLSRTGYCSDLFCFLQYDSRLIRYSFSRRCDCDAAVRSLE